jgi:cysteinyl-tRNA synthetase
VDEGKMAKSEGTGYSLQEIIDKGYDPLVLRYFFLTAQYRSQQNFTWDALDACKKALHDLRGMVASWRESDRTQLTAENLKKVDVFRKRFVEALENDLNIPGALAVVWEMAKSNIPSPDKYDLIMDFDQVLGFSLKEQRAKSKEQIIPEEIQMLVNERNKLRKGKKFDEADIIRKKIEEKGFLLRDTEKGTDAVKQRG